MEHGRYTEIATAALADSLDVGVLQPFGTIDMSSLTAVLDAFSLEVAQRYRAGALSYEEADDIMNRVWSFIVSDAFTRSDGTDEWTVPPTAVAVYDAFDSGEWIRPDDAPGTSSVAKYTDPAIDRVLESASIG